MKLGNEIWDAVISNSYLNVQTIEYWFQRLAANVYRHCPISIY